LCEWLTKGDWVIYTHREFDTFRGIFPNFGFPVELGAQTWCIRRVSSSFFYGVDKKNTPTADGGRPEEAKEADLRNRVKKIVF